MILVLGILGLVICFPLGIAAWIMGNGDLRQIDSGTMDPGGRSLTQAGKVIGMIATLLAVLGMIAGLAFALFAAIAAHH